MKKHTFKSLLLRRFIVVLLLLAQLGLILYFILNTSKSSVYLSYALHLLSFIVALHTVSRPQDPGYKLLWVFLVLLFPVFGGLFYLIFNQQRTSRRLGERIGIIHQQTENQFLLRATPELVKNQECPPQSVYLQEHCGFPVFINTGTEYFSPGEVFHAVLLRELKKAERYIFLEYFIISQGSMWESVLNVLVEKVSQGVDVRIVYDDMGCLAGIPFRYYRQLRSMGIQCVSFNPFRPVLAALQNNRDHRKIAVIDGKVAFTGGINLADEYVNAYERFGHWKDSAVMLKGPAAWGLTVIFLQMWQLLNPSRSIQYEDFLPEEAPAAPLPSGIVQPYADSPMDHDRVSEALYLQMIYGAKKTLYINTPYLILDEAMKHALMLAAKSGVDVRIITPQRGDKKLVHFTTRSFYPELLEAGVKIYEYAKGFNHSKTMCADGKTAIIGTANLDYRSLYLHFECGVFLSDTPAVDSLQRDFMQTLKHCTPVLPGAIKKSFLRNLFRDICRLLAPVL